MRLILVRHAETIANQEKKYLGHTDSNYTKKGLLQIDFLLSQLFNQNIDLLYCSPLNRTLKIAQLISNKIQKDYIIEPALKEMNFGIFDNLTYKEIEYYYPWEWNSWCKDTSNYKIPNGERFSDVFFRVKNFIESIKSIDQNILIITHGGVIRIIMTYLLDLNHNQTWHFSIPPASIITIDYNNNYGLLLSMINYDSYK